MKKFKLTYFDFDGGRGEPARLALRIGGIEFEDCRIPVAEWPEVKDNYRYHQLPELEVDGAVLNQSNVITPVKCGRWLLCTAAVRLGR